MMETMTVAEDDAPPRALLPSWRVMVDLLAGVPSVLPEPRSRRITTHRFDSLSEVEEAL